MFATERSVDYINSHTDQRKGDETYTIDSNTANTPASWKKERSHCRTTSTGRRPEYRLKSMTRRHHPGAIKHTRLPDGSEVRIGSPISDNDSSP
jgi:hypothetical protein